MSSSTPAEASSSTNTGATNGTSSGNGSLNGIAASALPIAYHVPNALLSYNRFASLANKPTAAAAAQASRRPPIPHPSGLETLDEVSHVNALHLATGRAPTGLGSSALRADVDKAADAALSTLPPCQRCLAMARADGYNIVAIELANERWKERWERLCLDGGDTSGEEEVEGGGLVRSSSRSGLLGLSGPSSASATLQEAEEWRRSPSFNRAEVNITKVEESEGVLVILSQWIELDAIDEGVRLDSEIALQQELAYASHIGISQVILPPPSSDPERRKYLPDYARAIANCITAPSSAGSAPAGQWITLSVRLPISSPYELARKLAKNRSSNGSASDVVSNHTSSSLGSKVETGSHRVEDDWAWETWNVIQQACSYSPRVQVTLDLAYPLPGSSALSRWPSEPVSAMFVPSAAFLANAKGFPVLSKASQSLFRSLIKKRPAIVLSEVDTPPSQHVRGGANAYLQYVRHLERSAPLDTPLDVFAKGYTDWLQAPLQPLMDNLESSTYEVFERDPIKYQLYEEALYRALRDRTQAGHTFTSIWVCGAGRGPLVTRCIAASTRAKARVKITALEKNPNALVVLQEKQALEWGTDLVSVIYGDMRARPVQHERADIVVSELLGSFGDNELSPECLDGAMRFLKPTGISIPAAYTSFLAPISSAKLYAEVLGHGASGSALTEEKKLKSAETPYVVMFQSVSFLASKGGRGSWDAVQACWAFHHGPADIHAPVCDEKGLPMTNSHNVRTSTHTFHIPQAGLCHGFAGYFEADLYEDVVMSIHPDPKRYSKDMLSWFPIYFPFKDPLYLPAGSELDIHLWRMSSTKRVWYEWYAEVYLPLPASAASVMQPSFSTSSSDTVHLHQQIDFLSGGHQHGAGGADASFQNAPGTPSLLSVNHSDGHNRWSSHSAASGGGSVVGGVGGAAGSSKTVRIKTGMTALMNPGGRSSWIGL